MKITAKNITPCYTLIQCLYWSIYCLMYGFASAYLLSKGFSNASIGMVLGFSYAFSALLQPAIASHINRSGLGVSFVLWRITAIIAVLASAMLLLPLKGFALGATMSLMCTLHSAMQPSINSLHRGYELQGLPVNFGLARGTGSFSFAVVTFIIGQVLRRVGTQVIPAAYLGCTLLLMLCLILFRSPAFAMNSSSLHDQQTPLLRRCPRFGLFLLGLVLLSLAHIFIDNFMLQILQSIGGDSADLGAALAIAAMVELPAMVLYARAAKKAGANRVLCFAGWLWALKNLLIFVAKSPAAVFAAELLQFFSYAMYVPATVDYIARSLPEGDFLKAQALSGSAFTIGSLLAAMLGGPAIDLLGVRSALGLSQFFSIAGAVLFTLGTLPFRKRD